MTYINAEDGVRLFVRQDGRQELPAVLMSHALGATHGMWDAQVEALASRFHLIRYDARGHGQSDAPLEDYTIERLGRDALNVLDALMIRHATFVGLSMGGLVGQWLASHSPERFDRLVLASTTPWHGPPENWTERMATVGAKGVAPLVEPTLERWFTAGFRAAAPETVEAVGAALRATTATGYLGCCAALRDADLRAEAAAITAPVLLIAGTHDPAGAVDAARTMADTLKDARVLELEAAHLLNVERPDDFNHAVRDFLTV